ncbi:MAG: bifunctional 2-polyprenyl-6-hydroxyphenol methylase/3-demethylubiquinol 3-O-methyltransferase UbiG [Altererythrobacter sp.]|nr:bifunctional 2-polyprenyl-6-hydroxyphenol methylase/3-demethylubiquinol 3-O-methyltransferase UbiG [Altererythrobacter sp.]MBT8431113.1 bifunctional 2-polyprenyl-6-hydroxyphenol methylase/3-demethylubiquinol 3-O-methyltransferase UbiG [Altererythrobacter sp.]NNF93089.1 bifunctional 2-polyprenyl-6-hydroxyphenol methylase/3-demethylubiquinol 3-O-methyltransferase UbiG [Altererythrobacter sp.]NNK45135.1 bifunctional 2-polyprenyl-6-hydroxyphenol methylase/3-demethylubiquinol 3-O-methyltransferase
MTETATTIRPEEAEHFSSLAREWWNAKGPMASLHQVNPVRLAFLREAIDRHWSGNVNATKPLADKNAIDVGCGAGLVCEPMARWGANVTGVDASAENVGVAAAHAESSGLDIRYIAGELASLNLGAFDLVTGFEVIEHVSDKAAFLAQLAASLKPDGLLVMSTPNRTAASRLLLVEAAERVGYVPRGTHDWNDFVTPEELSDLLTQAGLEMGDPRGIAWRPSKGLHLSDDLSLNYAFTARHAR